MREVRVRGEHRQLVADAKLRQECVNRANLNTTSPADIPQLGGADMILAVWHQERQRGKSFDDCVAGGWAGKSLEQLLEDQPGRDDLLAEIERLPEELHLGVLGPAVAPQCEMLMAVKKRA